MARTLQLDAAVHGTGLNLCCLLAVWPWASDLPTLGLAFKVRAVLHDPCYKVTVLL